MAGTPPVNTMRYGTSTFSFYAEISTRVLNYVNPFKINVKSAPANTKIVFKVGTIFYKINNSGQLQTVVDLFGEGNTVAEINAKASISCLKGKQFQVFFLAPGENLTVTADITQLVNSRIEEQLKTKVMTYNNDIDIRVKSAPAGTKISILSGGVYYKLDAKSNLIAISNLDQGNTVDEINKSPCITGLKKKPFQVYFLAPDGNSTVLAELYEHVERTDIIQFFTELKTNIQTLYNEFELRVKQAPAGSKISIQVNDKDMYKLGTEGKLTPTKTTDEGTSVDEANKTKEVSDLRGKKFRVYVLAPGQNASALIKIKELKNYIIEWFRDKEAGK